jgi:hypothetical protein
MAPLAKLADRLFYSRNERVEKDLRPARCTRWSRPLSLIRLGARIQPHVKLNEKC